MRSLPCQGKNTMHASNDFTHGALEVVMMILTASGTRMSTKCGPVPTYEDKS